MKKATIIFLIGFVMAMFFGCDAATQAATIDRANALTSDAAVARRNLETAEQNFQVYRRVVFYNGITGDYILQIEGYLAIIVDGDGDLVVTVKTEDGKYLKHYKVVFKPSVIIPTIEIK